MFPTSFPTDEESDSITEALPVLCEDLCPQYWIAPHIWSCSEKAICELYDDNSNDSWPKVKSLIKDRDDIRIIYADGMVTDASEHVPSQCSVLYIYTRGVPYNKICDFGVSYKSMSQPQTIEPMRCAVVKIPGFDEVLDIINRTRDEPLTAFDLATLKMKPVTKINNFWDHELEKSMTPQSHVKYDESMWKRIKWFAVRLWSFDEHAYGGLIHLPMFNNTFTRMVEFTPELNPDDVILPFDVPLFESYATEGPACFFRIKAIFQCDLSCGHHKGLSMDEYVKAFIDHVDGVKS